MISRLPRTATVTARAGRVAVAAALVAGCSDDTALIEANAPEPAPAPVAVAYPAEYGPALAAAAAARAAPRPALPDPRRRVTADAEAATRDPAMLRHVPGGEAALAAAAGAATNDGPNGGPDDGQDVTLRADPGSRRVFLPGAGWLPAAEVRALYENRPDALPAGLDLERLHHVLAAFEDRS